MEAYSPEMETKQGRFTVFELEFDFIPAEESTVQMCELHASLKHNKEQKQPLNSRFKVRHH